MSLSVIKEPTQLPKWDKLMSQIDKNNGCNALGIQTPLYSRSRVSITSILAYGLYLYGL